MADSDDRSPVTFVVPGTRPTSRSGGAAVAMPSDVVSGTVKDAARLQARRAGGEMLRLQAVPGEDVVVLRLADGPALVLHPYTARDLMLAQQATARRSGGTAAPGEVEVPAQLRWRGLEQAAPTRGAGSLGDVLLAGLEIVTGLFKDPAADFVAGAVVAKVDGQVEAGVYRLQRDALEPLKGSGRRVDAVPLAGGGPILVLVHGTFVETVSTFGKLWTMHPQQVASLFDRYAEQVYALDHPTLGASPFANALTLVQALPAGARLHLLTHSRGGLVAEVLARVAGLVQAGRTVGAADFAFFAGAEYAGQRDELQRLAAALKAKGVVVERVVRVACPARGTLLASKRLDAYVSVLKWTLELAGLAVAPALLDFLTEVARRRADPTMIPGLAAMIPDTPLVRWLNEADVAIPGDLRVLAGDLEGDSLGSWLKTLLADAYYWTDNDIVVQTSSMYGGTPRDPERGGRASFFLDQGGKSTHFNYFANERSVRAVTAALRDDEPDGWRPIGPLSWAGKASDGLRAARRSGGDAAAAAERPAVFVIPGILGSHLKDGDSRIWLSLRLVAGLERLAYEAGSERVQPDGAIGMVYDDLMEHLAATHEVIEFAFDWRRPIEEEARRLATAVGAELDRRSASGQPVRIVAHSMGGVLTRTMQLEAPKTWERFIKRDGARVLMLGTPNGGSWAPMQVLSGDDTFGNALAAFGSPLRNRRARQLMAEMPGFIQLQAELLDMRLGLGQQETWQRLAREDLQRVQEVNWWHRSQGEAGEAAYEWGVPPQAVLDQAVALRRRLDEQRDRELHAFAEKILLVVGQAEFTPDGYEWGSNGFVYLNAVRGGDGRVPLSSALLPGVRTWTVDAEHGSLPDVKEAFAAYTDLLNLGSTDRLPLLQVNRSREARVAVAHVRSRPSRQKSLPVPAGKASGVFAALPLDSRPAAPGLRPLKVRVLNGNLRFVRSTLMIGHFSWPELSGSEEVVDGLLGHALRESLAIGLYPQAVGQHQLFVNTYRSIKRGQWMPQPQQVLVVGLGEVGKLKEADLVRTVQQGVIAWAMQTAQSGQGVGVTVELSATLIGSGGVLSPAAAARSLALGVLKANEALSSIPHAAWPQVAHLTLVELYLDRASEAWSGLQLLSETMPGRLEMTGPIESGVGPLRRPLGGSYRSASYDFVSVTSTADGVISFALDTRRARTEVTENMTQGRLIRELVRQAATETNRDDALGRTLLQLLVPVSVRPFLSGSERMLLELDLHTAAIPWELLDTETADGGRRSPDKGDPPWAIRSELLRKLRTDEYRMQVKDAQDGDAILVIGEPKVDLNQYPALPGARAEAEAIAVLARHSVGHGLVDVVMDADATTVIKTLFQRRYRIVHVAGHGEPVEVDAATGALKRSRGVVLSDSIFLGSSEIRSMETVPALVFVNCCHLARSDSGALQPNKVDRALFAAGVSQSLIDIGVRCVIAAGWAVDDGPAKVFAETFYKALLRQQPFIKAVAEARMAAWIAAPDSNTWAAYQAYGDPNWVFDGASGESGQSDVARATEEVRGISSPLSLAMALEEVAVNVHWSEADTDAARDRVRRLERHFGKEWGDMGAVAEAFGVAYSEIGDFEAAIAWLERALSAPDASATLKTQERLHNLRARRAWGTASRSKPGSAAFERARAEVSGAASSLALLVTLQASVERCALEGSAYKRLGLLEQRAGQNEAAREAFARAAEAYARAEALAAARQDPDLFYPALNRMGLQYVASGGGRDWSGFDDAAVTATRRSLGQAAARAPDFWCHVGQIELDLLLALSGRQLAISLEDLLQRFALMRDRVASPKMWSSVADNAALLLETHASRTRGAEAAAAEALLATLRGYAQG